MLFGMRHDLQLTDSEITTTHSEIVRPASDLVNRDL
jgi:hypothetical protein